MKIVATLMIIGLVLLSYSWTLDPYTDESVYQAKYAQMTSTDSDAFAQLRGEMLTSKFQLQDYGITFISSGLLFWIMSVFGGGRIYSVGSSKGLTGLAIALPLLSACGFVFALFQGASRGDYPHWADSMGIPLAGVPVIVIALSVWSWGHLRLFAGHDPERMPIAETITLKLNPWLIFVCAVMAFLILSSAWYGVYWEVLPGFLWLYFHLSLGTAGLAAPLNHMSK